MTDERKPIPPKPQSVIFVQEPQSDEHSMAAAGFAIMLLFGCMMGWIGHIVFSALRAWGGW